MELRDSIKEFGILQPLIIKKQDDGRYMLIAGGEKTSCSVHGRSE